MSSVLPPMGDRGGDGPAQSLCSLRPAGEEGWVSPPGRLADGSAASLAEERP